MNFTKLLPVLLFFGISIQVNGQHHVKDTVLFASDSTLNDFVGTSIDKDGDYIVTGAQLKFGINANNDTVPGAGAAYVFKLSGGVWSQVQKLQPSKLDTGMRFGASVSIKDSFIVVTAPLDDFDENDTNKANDAGSCFIYKLNSQGTWVFRDKIVAYDRGMGIRFGQSAIVQKDFLAIGCINTTTDSTGKNGLTAAGAVYIYNLVNDSFQFVHKLTPFSRKAYDWFGFSIDADSNQLLVGAPSRRQIDPFTNLPMIDAGGVFLFRKDSNGIWKYRQEMIANDISISDKYGTTVALGNGSLLVGAVGEDYLNIPDAGSVYLHFRPINGFYYGQKKIGANDASYFGDYFGKSLGVVDSTYFVGSVNALLTPRNSWHGSKGGVYKIERNGSHISNWGITEKIVDTTLGFDQGFGSSIVADSAYLYVGVQGSGTANSNYHGSIHIYYNCETVIDSLTNTICQGDSVLLGGGYQTQSGTYYDTLQTVKGCDSVLITQLVVNPTFQTPLKDTICQGDSVLLGGSYQTQSGSFYDTLQTVKGCDSVLITQLVVNPTFQTMLSDTICQGDSVLLGGGYQTQSGTYHDTLQTVKGCDSVLITQLVVNPTFQTPLNDTICQGDSVLLGGIYQTQSGTYYDTLQTVEGCDSLLITQLEVNPTYQTPLNDTICQGDSVLLGGSYQSQSGIYYDTLQTLKGCDSVLITQLVVNPTYQTPLNDTICQGDSVLLGGSYQTQSGTFYDTLQTVKGCDSVLITQLVVNPTFQTPLNDTICQGDSVLLGGSYQTQSGTYLDTLQTVKGCDSVLITQLVVNPTIQTPLNDTICQGDSILLGGKYQTQSGTYYDTLQAVEGCDSIVVTSLTVNYVSDSITKVGNILISSFQNAIHQWMNCDDMSLIQGANSFTFEPKSNGFFTVMTTIKGCTDTAQCAEVMGLGINSFSANVNVSVYPNPSNSLIVVKSSSRIETVLIQNSLGQQVRKFDNIKSLELELDLSQYENGLFFISVKTQDQWIRIPLIKN
ncbi:MAG: T9SS type A sorting domain-containing protein [Flavobacteriales bacterium]|nr:T9SS type A sorting domain-containing protein [Flavobacteriales bacterium]